MEYCTLDDAFPATAAASGCRGTEATSSQRREERRKARRCKNPATEGMESDPDRQVLGAGVPTPMRGSGAATGQVNPYNPATGLTEHAPLTAEPIGQQEDDIIAAVPRSAYMARRQPANTVAAHVQLRETEGPTTLISSASQQPPAYFGADPLNGPDPKSSLAFKEDFANYNPIAGDFNLEPNFEKTFGQPAENRAAGAGLPIPSIVDAWKRLTPSGANTAFIEYLPPPGGELMPFGLGQGQGRNPKEEYVVGQQQGQQYIQNDMKRRFDEIFSRLDDLENRMTTGSENTQMELFLFILSGMFVMFSIDMFAARR